MRRYSACGNTGYTDMSSVLFVSHDDDLRAVASRVLRRAGWQVTAAAHGGHAVLACVDGQTFDVLVVEHAMPEESGAALAMRLRRYCPQLQVVSMREHGAAEPREGITVVRPFSADDLIDAVLEAAAAAIVTA